MKRLSIINNPSGLVLYYYLCMTRGFGILARCLEWEAKSSTQKIERVFVIGEIKRTSCSCVSYGEYGAMTMHELWPPNPKELEIAAAPQQNNCETLNCNYNFKPQSELAY
jgi:hypothetical protein